MDLLDEFMRELKIVDYSEAALLLKFYNFLKEKGVIRE